MANHRDRMRFFGQIAVPEMSPEQKKQFIARTPPHLRKKIEQNYARCVAQMRATLKNGAGLLADQQLREFLSEYNGRTVNHGLRSLPASFNIMEAFFSYERDTCFFWLHNERDHLFSFSDFIDFLTLEGSTLDSYQASYKLQDGVIYSFTAIGDPHDLAFSTPLGKEYGIGGVSLIRHGDELTVMLIAGRAANLVEESRKLQNISLESLHKKEGIKPDPDKRAEAVALGDAKDFWKTLALARFNIKQKMQDARYLLADWGNMYDMVTDDPSVYPSDNPDPRQMEIIEKQQRELETALVLFELCKSAPLLVPYFDFKLSLVRSEKVSTALGQREADAAPNSSPSLKDKTPPKSRVLFRTVAALRVIDTMRTPVARRFTAPKYQVQIEGFWRRLPPGTQGYGQNGEPVVGRTWVKGHIRWREQPVKPVHVLVKSRVAIARAVVEAEQRVNEVVAQGAPRDATTVTVADEPGVTAHRRIVSREDMYRQRRLLNNRLRYAIMLRDDFRCLLCGADAASDRNVRLDVDHVLPIVEGGKTEPTNLRTLCSRCNNGKGETLAELERFTTHRQTP